MKEEIMKQIEVKIRKDSHKENGTKGDENGN